jgi:deoxyribodipyrimidine photo-lyase
VAFDEAGIDELHRGSNDHGGFLAERLLGTPRPYAQAGGLGEGADTLRSFLRERGHPYTRGMSSPLTAPSACSRLSPHLAYGTVSLRTVHHALEERAAELKAHGAAAATGGGSLSQWRQALSSFRKRLRWHDHFIQKLESEPEIEFRNMSRVYDGLREEDEDGWDAETRARLQAWEDGRTGYPMVDACMRSLAATGWINFRMRAMLVSFAAYHLWLHWRPVARVLARRFVDFEPGIHYAQCQMQSGVTGINALRIYSPARQLLDHDPDGEFVRAWVPELADVPLDVLAEPHLMSRALQDRVGCRIGRDYPAPLVEHREAYRAARARIGAIRKTPEAREESQRVYRRHGSRRRGRRTALARKPRESDQLSLDV